MKIKIDGYEYTDFNDITVNLSLDSIASTFSFVARYNNRNNEHRKLFRPLSFHTVEIFDDNENLMLTGTILSHSFSSTSSPNLVRLSGYSTPGILEDCTIPLNNYPLESLNRSLKEITEKLISPYNLILKIDSSVKNEVDTIYEKSVASPTESVKDYLSKLAAQRNVIISHNAQGNLVFFRPNVSSTPKHFFNEESDISMNMSINGQQLHSEISVIRQPSNDDSQVSLSDSALNRNVLLFRPKVNVLSSGKSVDTKKAAENKLAEELKSISLNVSTSGFLDLLPGDIVEVQNREIFLSQKVKFMVSSIVVKENEKGVNSSLNLVLPETFSGEIPEIIFS